MIKEKKNNYDRRKIRILIAPLDWGLGHATRCIPIINELIRIDCEVILAADGAVLSLLKKEFPSIKILALKGYKIRYSHKRKWLFLQLFFQIPKIVWIVFKEHYWLKKIIKEYKPDIIISDNRLGLYSSGIFSVYITHQLAIKTGNYFLDKIARQIHCHFIKKYDQCWVPDFQDNGLAGELSHPKKLPANVVYMGALSRFEKLPEVNKVYDILISISGPEPQRTIFENIIFSQLKYNERKILIVRGLPAQVDNIKPPNSFTEVINHLSANGLSRAFQQAEIVICRSGYTTIMDLVKINKNAILIPTPSQTEQEYLAKYLMEKRFFFSIEQHNFVLEKAINDASFFPFLRLPNEMEGFKKLLAEFVLSFKSGKLQLNNF
ncbi:MAG: glycosyltransferase [Ginsengibacter sp.]